MARGQQTPATDTSCDRPDTAAPAATPATTTQTQDQTTTPDQSTSTPATTKPTADQALPQNQTQIPTIPQTEKTIGLPATHAPKAVKHKWTPTTGTTSALPGMAPAKTTNGKPARAPTTGSALTQPTTETGTTPKATNAADQRLHNRRRRRERRRSRQGRAGQRLHNRRRRGAQLQSQRRQVVERRGSNQAANRDQHGCV